MFLNNKQVIEEIKGEIKNFPEKNDNENMMTQKLWEAANAVLRRKFTVIQFYFKKLEKHWIDNLTLHLKQLGKWEQKKKVSRRKIIIKIRAEMRKKWRKQQYRLTKLKAISFRRLKKLTNHYVRDYYNQLYAKKVDNLEEMDRFLEKFNLLSLNQEEVESMSQPITSTEIQTVIKSLPKKQNPRARYFNREFYQAFREELMPILLKVFQKIADEGTLPNYKTTITLIPKSDKI